MSVVDLVPYLNQSPTAPDSEPEHGCETGAVVPLNTEALVFGALAVAIESSAFGWSDCELARLEGELQARYGAEIGGRTAVRKLVRLASNRPPA